MVDQLASIGVEFYPPSALRLIKQQLDFYKEQAINIAAHTEQPPPQWATERIYQANLPIRPWGLGNLEASSSIVNWVTGQTPRTPGQYRQTNPHTGDDHHGPFLLDTNERVHSSVRVRLACRGLGVNDKGEWAAPALGNWRLRKTTARYEDPVPRDPDWDPRNHAAVSRVVARDKTSDCGRKPNDTTGERWIWEYVGPEKDAPTDRKQRVMVEEPLGPYERFFLNQVGGIPNVYVFAEARDVTSMQELKKNKYKRYHDAEWADE